MGSADVFAMGPGYTPAPGMRRFLSGTPPIVGMLALQDTLALIEEVGIDAIRQKSIALTDLFIALVESRCAGMDLELVTPATPARAAARCRLRMRRAAMP